MFHVKHEFACVDVVSRGTQTLRKRFHVKQSFPVSHRCFTWNNSAFCFMPLFHMKQKCHPFGWHLSLSIKSVFTPKQQSRGRAHSKAFATQTHENRGRVPRFSYFKREKVSVWELSDVRVLRSQNTDCRKNDSFSTVSKPRMFPGFPSFTQFSPAKRFTGRRPPAVRRTLPYRQRARRRRRSRPER